MRKELAAERGCLVIASLLVLDELCVSSGRRAGFQLDVLRWQDYCGGFFWKKHSTTSPSA